MSSHSSHNDVQHELESLSPELARLRAKGIPPVDMNMLHSLGNAALEAVPVIGSVPPTMRVVHRKQRWIGRVAASIAIVLGALVTYTVLSVEEDQTSDDALSSTALSAELIASFEEQTADPIAFLLDDEFLFDDEEALFSPAEDILLDWAEDGNVDEALSEEVMLDVIR